MSDEPSVDELDLRILQHLQGDARLSFREIGKRVHASTGTVSERVHAMQRTGVIRAFVTAVDPEKLGMRVTMLLAVRTEPSLDREELERRVMSIREAACVHFVTGDVDVILLLRCRDQSDAVEALDRVKKLVGVKNVDSYVILKSLPLCGKCGCDCGFSPDEGGPARRGRSGGRRRARG